MSRKQKNLPTKGYDPSLLEPLRVEDFGGKKDPCFGVKYDLSTPECKLCGDSELCCTRMAENLGKTRKQMEKENNYKDLDNEVDISGITKYIKSMARKDKTKKEILVAIREKYELTVTESRDIYRKSKS